MNNLKFVKKIRSLGFFGFVIGILLIFLGLIGVVVPFMPGIILILLGIVILGFDLPFLKSIYQKVSEIYKQRKTKSKEKQR